jgi:hypothetical protein
MKKAVGFFACLVLLTSCSTYKTKVDFDQKEAIKKITKAGLIFRVSRNSRIPREDHLANAAHWLAGSCTVRPIKIISPCSDGVCAFSKGEDRFYQVSDASGFLKYKSAGVVNLYLRSNAEELKKILAENDIDALFIYEVYGVMSPEMQFFEFESVLCVVDSSLAVIYRDHQSNYFETDGVTAEKMKLDLLDKISSRLVKALEDLKFVKM